MIRNLELKRKSCALRREILRVVYRAKTGHIGGDFSVCDILNVLYNKHLNISPETVTNPARDRFILSKGHTAEALYCVLADRGFFDPALLETFSSFGSMLTGHPNRSVPGVELNSGSLGHGLSVGVGMALAGKMDNAPYHVFVVLGDGELAEGSVWEGVMAAGHYGLDNLIALVDRNRLQISGSTEEVMPHEPLEERFRSFGWNVLQCDGNDIDALDDTIAAAKQLPGRPIAILVNTTKGCGVSFLENQASWHHRVPTEQEYHLAIKELTKQEAQYDKYDC